MKRLFLFAFVMLAGTASAQTESDSANTGRLRLGPLGLTPSIAIQSLGIDSNVFNESENPKQDVTATVHPRVDAWLRLGRARLSLGGSIEAVHFKRYSSQRSINADGSATLDVRLNRVNIFAGTGFVRTRQRPGFEIDLRPLQVQHALKAGTDVRLSGKTNVGVRAERRTIDFALDAKISGTSLGEALNRREETVTGFLEHKLTPMTTLVLNADVERDTFEFSPARDSRRLLITPGVQFKPNALVSGSAFVGYRRFDLQQATAPPFYGAYASIDLSYTLLGRTRFGVQSLRDVDYSFDVSQPYYLLSGVTGSISQALSPSWGVSVRAGRQRLNYRKAASSTLGDSQRADTVNEYGGSVIHRLSPSIQVGMNAEYHRRLSGDHLRDYKGLRAGGFITYGAGTR